MRLDEELDRAIGDGPAHRPVTERIEAGRRAVRRRRALASGAAALTVVAIVGGGWAVMGGDQSDPRSDAPFAGDPSAAPPEVPTLDGPVGLDDDCGLVVADGVEVLDSVDDPAGDAGDGECSVAVEYERRGTVRWTLLQTSTSADAESGLVTSSGSALSPTRPIPGTSFEDWARQMGSGMAVGPAMPRSLPAPVEGLVYFEDGETLVAEPGVLILEQTPDVDLKDFAGPGQRTAAAEIEVDGERYFVLAREIGGGPDYIADAPRADDETLPQFLDRASTLYDSGEGLL